MNFAAKNPPTDLEKRFVAKMIMGRTLALMLIFVSVLLFDSLYIKHPPAAFPVGQLLILVCMVQVLVILLRRKAATHDPFSQIPQIGLDLLVTTGVVYITGSSASPFSFLYLLLVMFVASYTSIYATMATALAGGSVYFALSWVTLNRAISLYDPSQVVVEPFGGIWLQTTGLTSGMILVGYLTNLLRQRILIGSEMVLRSQEELRSLDQLHRGVFDGIPHPTIIVNFRFEVERLNNCAKEMFGFGENIKGKIIWKIFERKVADFKGVVEATPPGRDIQLEVIVDFEPRYFRVHVQRLVESNDESDICFIFYDLTDLASAEERLAAHERMVLLLSRNDEEAHLSFQSHGFEVIGQSRAVQHVFDLVQRVARSEATVLITGESGTGKELVARAIHNRSERSQRAFVPVNCGAIPENLMESQFFGHVKGAFTGAERNHEGFFQQAHRGTLFLDEIAELPLSMQVKLLRVLQERRVRPVGAEKEIDVDVRILSATHRNLRDETGRGKFREDLYYRLNVVNIPIPPLRQRKDDIPILVEYFLRTLKDPGRELPMIHPDTLAALRAYDYPGNIRELQNIVERALILGGNAILPEHLPEIVRAGDGEKGRLRSSTQGTAVFEVESISLPCNLDNILDSLERMYLERALEKGYGSRKEAARLLGINARSLRYRLQKYGLEDSRSNEAGDTA
jgi:two-component system response regulator PilR (NtrC family)